eukprot:COSAG01_NODE_1241_length_11085_cov_9.712361_7_plen_40_part_00
MEPALWCPQNIDLWISNVMSEASTLGVADDEPPPDHEEL